MCRTMTFAAAALIALGSVSPAVAGKPKNRVSWNGVADHGRWLNGSAENGQTLDGRFPNGMDGAMASAVQASGPREAPPQPSSRGRAAASVSSSSAGMASSRRERSAPARASSSTSAAASARRRAPTMRAAPFSRWAMPASA